MNDLVKQRVASAVLRRRVDKLEALPLAKSGDRGLMGLPGKKGDPGKDGEPGSQGEPGADGADGVDGGQGPHGVKGAKGMRGEPGIDGVNGEHGQDGDQGEPGKDGINGESGTQGEPGIDGVSITRVEVDKNNRLYLWLDDKKTLAGTIKVKTPIGPFIPGGSGGGKGPHIVDATSQFKYIMTDEDGNVMTSDGDVMYSLEEVAA